MKLLQNFPIMTRLAVGFSLVVALSVTLGVLAYHAAGSLSAITSELAQHPMAVTNAALAAETDIVGIRETMLEVVVADAPEKIDGYMKTVADLDASIGRHLEVLRERYLGPREDLFEVSRALKRWAAVREEVARLARTGKRAEAEVIVRGGGARQTAEVREAIGKVIEFARNKATEFIAAAEAKRDSTLTGILLVVAGVVVLSALIAFLITHSINEPLSQLRNRMGRLAEGELAIEVPYLEARSEIGAMARALEVFKVTTQRMADRSWVKSNAADITQRCLSVTSVRDLGHEVIRGLTPLLGGGHGVFYLADQGKQRLELLASYAFTERKRLGDVVAFGEGLTGQCVIERTPIILTEVPPDYVRIGSALGQAPPATIAAVPVLNGRTVVGVIEIATFKAFTEAQRALLEEVLPAIAMHIEILERRRQMQELLERTQRQAEDLRASEEELQAQSEELRAGNEELQEKTVLLTQQAAELRASEEELRAQREELQATNEELTEKGRALEAARVESETRAHQLGQASRYKSEFLANMSHELRTPLNSLLILSRTLADNREATLTPDQVESAQVIYDSGSQLLRLINDILDLSKIESGRVELTVETVAPTALIEPIERRLRPMAEAKGLGLTLELAPTLPERISTDIGKFEQIAANLISNAVKFTETGGITIRFAPARQGALTLTITDTGIGIPDDKREHIFLPFEQVDGTTSRRYGGTGLGLAISQKLARLLGGDITVASRPGEGSTFTLTIPAQSSQQGRPVAAALVPAPAATGMPATVVAPVALAAGRPLGDDPATLAAGEPVVLVVEDDISFARILADTARRRGFRCLVALNGAIGLKLAQDHLPIGIILDVGLPDIDGWSVMDKLKENTATRHIPVHFMSATDGRPRGLGMGAVGYLTKPVTREQIESALDRIGHFSPPEPRRLLVVDDDPGSRRAITALVGTDAVSITTADTGRAALELLRRETFDCVVLDLGLPDLTGTQLLAEVAADPGLTMPPVVIYSAKELSAEETQELRRYTDSIVIKGARSPERLLDEVTLFLHSVQSSLPEEGRRMLQRLHDPERCFVGKTVLLVEDDMRNAFALSRVLHGRGLTVQMAADGRKALKHLEDKSDIDIVLMDIMMPDMDGYETMRAIRQQPRFRTLPILALTAKAMAEDREKCLEAGANDYTTKPIDIDRLLSLMRVWLHR